MRNESHYNFIDVAKAFTSYIIVMVHTITPNNYYGYKPMQIGAMALFFFSSGFLFKESYTNLSFSSFVKKYAKKCLIPYFIGAILGIIICKLFPYWYGEYSNKDILYSIFVIGAPYAFGAVWYLLCLFFIEIVFYLFIKCIRPLKPKYKVFSIILFIVFFFLLAKTLNAYYSRPIFYKLPLKLDSSLTGIIYFSIGYLFKYLEFHRILNNKMLCLGIFIVTKVLSLYIETRYLGYTNICDCIYDNYDLYFLTQLLGIASFISLGAIFANSKILQKLGANNLLIYLLHPYVLWLLEEIYGRIIGIVRYEFYNIVEIIIITTITYILTALLADLLKKLYRKWSLIWLKKNQKN